MKLPVVLERLAEQDLEGHVDYIAADRPSAAAHFIDAAEAAFARLAGMPRIGAVRNFRNPRLECIRFWPKIIFLRHSSFIDLMNLQVLAI